MLKHTKILVFFFGLLACGQDVIEMKTPKNAEEKFEEFLAKKKFVKERFYSGIADEKMRSIITSKINKAASDFQIISESENPTNKKYQDKIEIGLSRFADVYLELDTEDRERVCAYFEELMDIIELETSNGQLNKFMYGFDPNEY